VARPRGEATGWSFSFPVPDLDPGEGPKQVTARYQFRAAGHTLVVRGVCGPCNAARRRYTM